LQDDVVSVLSSIGMLPEEEVLTASGYRLDALVEVNGMKVGIEVDGPSHFINREATLGQYASQTQTSVYSGWYLHCISAVLGVEQAWKRPCEETGIFAVQAGFKLELSKQGWNTSFNCHIFIRF
jgi:hypothetical protein